MDDWRAISRQEGQDVRLAVIHERAEIGLPVSLLESAFAAMDVRAEIAPIELPAQDFEEAVAHLAAQGFLGALVANPHKVLAARVGEKFFLARDSVGVANALLFQLKNYANNTEVGAFKQLISQFEPGKALVLGAGQGARSVVMALFTSGWKVRVWNRNAMKSRVLQTMFKRYGEIELPVQADPGACQLIVNATPVGAKAGEKPPVVTSHLGRNAVVADLVVRRVPTELLREAKMRGLKTISGQDLVAEQVALALEWWLGKPAPREAIRAAALRRD